MTQDHSPSFQLREDAPPTLSIEEIQQKLNAQKTKPMTEFKKNKLIKDVGRNWDLFYKRNTTNFFKDRHWTDREFEELKNEQGVPKTMGIKCVSYSIISYYAAPIQLVEIGCGVGNLVFPLLEVNPHLYINACDFSPRAVDFVKNSERYDPHRCHAFVCDITTDTLHSELEPSSIDFVSAVFVLSAIPPSTQSTVIQNIFQVLKPGGKVLFRDYGLHDVAQLRFKADNYIDDRFYARTDGTFSVFFDLEDVRKLFLSQGFVELENRYVYKNVVNRKEDKSMDRIFVQAKFMKPV